MLDPHQIQFTARELTVGEWRDWLLYMFYGNRDPRPLLRLICSRSGIRMRDLCALPLSELDDIARRLIDSIPESWKTSLMSKEFKDKRR